MHHPGTGRMHKNKSRNESRTSGALEEPGVGGWGGYEKRPFFLPFLLHISLGRDLQMGFPYLLPPTAVSHKGSGRSSRAVRYAARGAARAEEIWQNQLPFPGLVKVPLDFHLSFPPQLPNLRTGKVLLLFIQHIIYPLPAPHAL